MVKRKKINVYENKFYAVKRTKKSARDRLRYYHKIKGKIISIKFPYKKGGRRTWAVVLTKR